MARHRVRDDNELFCQTEVATTMMVIVMDWWW